MADHAETAWYPFELFGNVLAQGVKTTAAGGASFAWRRVHFLVSRQVIRQGTAHRLLARRLVGRWNLARRFAFVSLQVFQLQFQLLDLVVELLRLAAELHAPQFGNLQLEMLDLDGARAQLFVQTFHHLVLAEQWRLQAAMSLGRSARLSMHQVYCHPFTDTA